MPLKTLRRAVRGVAPLHRLIARTRGTRIHDPDYTPAEQVHLGSEYGGWSILPNLLDKNSVCYLVGVGTDISFDIAVMEKFGCQVHAFDPTPISKSWIESQNLPSLFHFHAVGLAAADGEFTLHAPSAAGHVSFSMNGNGDTNTKDTVKLPLQRTASIMKGLGHSHIDLLKMDIEGFEYDVIDDIIKSSIRPKQWLIEFHHTMYNHTRAETDAAVKTLRENGYRLFSVSNIGHEYSFALVD